MTESYSITYNCKTFLWEVWRYGKIIYLAISETIAEEWARVHYMDSWLYEEEG